MEGEFTKRTRDEVVIMEKRGLIKQTDNLFMEGKILMIFYVVYFKNGMYGMKSKFFQGSLQSGHMKMRLKDRDVSPLNKQII